MTDRLDTQAFVDALLDAAPDVERDQVAIDIIGHAAARLTMMVGGRETSAGLYAIADTAATLHIPGEVSRG